jgi:hypothetical protein
VRKLSDNAWDNLGLLLGVLACGTIGCQVWPEWCLPTPLSVSIWFVAGFLFVYLLRFAYGVRFSGRGIWPPNAVAAILQVLFAATVLKKG